MRESNSMGAKISDGSGPGWVVSDSIVVVPTLHSFQLHAIAIHTRFFPMQFPTAV